MPAQTNAYPPAGEIVVIDEIGSGTAENQRKPHGGSNLIELRACFQVWNEERTNADLLVRLQAQDGVVDIGNSHRTRAPKYCDTRVATGCYRCSHSSNAFLQRSQRRLVGRAECSWQGSVLDRASCGACACQLLNRAHHVQCVTVAVIRVNQHG